MSVGFYKWVSFKGFFRGFLGLFCVSSFFSSDFVFFGVSGAAAGEKRNLHPNLILHGSESGLGARRIL
jgi:hypothetical protein